MKFKKTLERFLVPKILVPVFLVGLIGANVSGKYIQDEETESNMGKTKPQTQWMDLYDSYYTVDGWKEGEIATYPFFKKIDSISGEVSWYESLDSN